MVLEPRRIAARMAARRVAEELGERVGETVGYQVRFEDVAGPHTRLRFVTEGILTRRLLTDPGSQGTSGGHRWTNFMNGISKPTWPLRYYAASNRRRALI